MGRGHAARAQGGASTGAQAGGWEAQCVVLAWLEQLVLLPFDLAALDSSLGANAEPDGCAARQPIALPPRHVCHMSEHVQPDRRPPAFPTHGLSLREARSSSMTGVSRR
jgi:hypothetical protein